MPPVTLFVPLFVSIQDLNTEHKLGHSRRVTLLGSKQEDKIHKHFDQIMTDLSADVGMYTNIPGQSVVNSGSLVFSVSSVRPLTVLTDRTFTK